MRLQQLATLIAYNQLLVKPEGISFGRWSAMCKMAYNEAQRLS